MEDVLPVGKLVVADAPGDDGGDLLALLVQAVAANTTAAVTAINRRMAAFLPRRHSRSHAPR